MKLDNAKILVKGWCKMNSGKKFEIDFKNSIPSRVFFYRFRDGTANWGNQDKSNTRFQAMNICDCFIMAYGKLWMIELKSHAGKSLPFSCIRENQIKDMLNADKFYSINAVFVINMRDCEETYCISVKDVVCYMQDTERKSIPIEWMREKGLKLKQRKLKVNYRYDIENILGKIVEKDNLLK
jgi:recombination protein U